MSGVITLSYTFDISEDDVNPKIWAILMKLSAGKTLEIGSEEFMGAVTSTYLDVEIRENLVQSISDAFSVPAEDDEDCEYSNCSDEEEMESVVCQCGMTHHFKVSDKAVAYACKNCDEWKKSQPQRPCGCLINEDECCAECAED